LIQEPSVVTEGTKRLTKTHPGYQVFSPSDNWEERPRVLTYVRKGKGLVSIQARPIASRDVCWVAVDGITFVNVYREPNTSTALEVLERWDVPQKVVIGGDFNASHWYWQPGLRRHWGEGDRIYSWAEKLGSSI
jgi:hypothetical protein